MEGPLEGFGKPRCAELSQAVRGSSAGPQLVLSSLAPSKCTPGTLLPHCRRVGTRGPGRKGFLGWQRSLGVRGESWKVLVLFTQSSRWEPSCAQPSSDVTLCPVMGIYCNQGFEMLQKCHRTLGDAKFSLLAHPQPFRGFLSNLVAL